MNPSWLERANTAKPALSTYAAVDWKQIGDYILRNGQDRKYVLDGDTVGSTSTFPLRWTATRSAPRRSTRSTR